MNRQIYRKEEEKLVGKRKMPEEQECHKILRISVGAIIKNEVENNNLK